MTTVIEASGLVKRYGTHHALNGLDLTVSRGEVHGFLGPNGAGKSTTIRILMGLARPDAGQLSLLGGDPWHDAVELHRRVVHVPGDVELWPTLTGGETIDLLGRMRGGLDGIRRDELIERFDLDPSKKARSYSTGNRQKVALIAAFASTAELLILDEPTSGLDPLMELIFQDEVTRVREQGRTVLLSSHILAEVERLADRVTIVRHGETVESGALADLRHLSGTFIVATTERPATGIGDIPGVSALEFDGTAARFLVTDDSLGRAVDYLGSCGLASLTSNPPSLEELMLRHYDTAAGHA